ncbi:ATP-binding cassette, subfamily F, member 3 [Marinitoga hydrogenitolerans DSM 16785]|uniref:ATP-binding cassette, subfamily F, member 3 n=1 Tax=Marinitoga hydrogenitolerans (strain DSM 16785 / JCM 12826 / AT1271) TaxID=1122195 RepID=A0A1M4V8A4_MARH1|nr:ABC-F family ATP-binding cassette domain-containing protein [Marinitoga hydrogenitolerans]SHE65184.1 ATP-binding cassette, subfamily F, member 3 [Marinitoga hydrogenitolerans DSM 16785]
MLFKIENVSHNFGNQDIFYDVNLFVYEQDRIALIGPNGSGKTTLLKIINGEIEPLEGTVLKTKNLKLGYLKQFRTEELNLSLFEYVLKEIEKNINDEMKNKIVRSVLKGMGFKESEWERKINSLSGGELTRLALGRVLAGDYNLLILDEPTNHLDIYSIKWLINHLKNYKGALIFVSHDRTFISELANKFWEINNYKIWNFNGNYNQYLTLRKNKLTNIINRKKNLEKEIERLNAMIERFRKWGTEKMMKQAKFRETLRDKLIKEYEEIDNLKDDEIIKIKIPEPKRTGYNVLTVKNLSFGYEKGNLLLKNFNFEINEGEKITILGKNGCGKSTLLKILMGKLNSYNGIVNWGYNIKIGYLDQVISSLNKSLNVMNIIWKDVPEWKDFEVRKYLGRFGFSGDSVFKNVNSLSGGELTRLALSKLILQKPNVLILDEPTNHLDIFTVQTLEETLKEFKGSIIMVSHDEDLIKNISDRIFLIKDANLKEYGNFEEVLPKLIDDSFKLKKQNRTNLDFELSKKIKNKIKSLKREKKKLEGEFEDILLKIDEIENLMFTYSQNYQKLMELENEKSLLEKKLNDISNRENEIILELQELENIGG